jgi:hypothetical protein
MGTGDTGNGDAPWLRVCPAALHQFLRHSKGPIHQEGARQESAELEEEAAPDEENPEHEA